MAQNEIEEIQKAIEALENQRALLGDAIVDTAVAPLQEKLAALQTAGSPDQQRKLVTTLFLDVVNSTAMVRDMDPEDHLAIMDGAMQRMTLPVEANGGRVFKYMGDGLMALFGHPVARENEPELAVRAALHMLEVAGDYAREVEAQWGVVDYSVRIGMSTGMAIIGGGAEGENTVAGRHVNLAARLETAAPPGGLFISHSTYQQVRGLFDIEQQEPIKAKGFAESQAAYRVIRARPRRFLQTPRGIEGVATRMIGRDAELSLLQEAYAAIAEQGDGRLITIVGEAGIGKSRLLTEYGAWLELQPQAVRILHGRAHPQSQEAPYSLLRDLFTTEFKIQEDDRAQRVSRKFEQGFKEQLGDSESTEVGAHYAGQMLGFDFDASPHLALALMDPKHLREQALSAVGDYVIAAARSQPVVIFLEDLHWADRSSLDALDHLFQDLSSSPILTVAMTRPGLFQRFPAWGEASPLQQRINLLPLIGENGRLLVEEVLKKLENIPTSLRLLIAENAEGNPFYVEEMVKMLIDEGIIVNVEPRWRLQANQISEIKVPPSLTGVLQARLDRLDPETKTVLQQASVVGRVFWDNTVAYIYSRSGSDQNISQIDLSLQMLQDREMVFEQTTSRFTDTTEHQFKHALLRDVTYETVLKRLRRDYHGLAANWLIENSADRQGEIYGLIATHLEKAGKESEAISYLKIAADLAVAAYANEEAIAFLQRGVNLIRRLPDSLEHKKQELDFQIALYGPLGVIKGWGAPEVATAFNRARELSTEAGDPGQLFLALYGLWGYNVTHANLSTAIELAQQCLSLAESTSEPPLLMEAHRLLDESLYFMGDFINARKHLEAGYAIYDPNIHGAHATIYGQDPGVAFLGYEAWIVWHLGYPDLALERSRQQIALGQSLSHVASHAYALAWSAFCSYLVRDTRTTQHLAEMCIALSAEHGFPLFLGEATMLLGWAHAQDGQAETGISELLQGLDILRNIGAEIGVVSGLGMLAEAYGNAGQFEPAEHAIDEGLQLLGNSGAYAYAPELHRIKGELALARTRSPEQAEKSFRQALDIARRQRARTPQLRISVNLARLLKEQGKSEEAHFLLSEIFNWFTEGFDTADLREARALLDELAHFNNQ